MWLGIIFLTLHYLSLIDGQFMLESPIARKINANALERRIFKRQTSLSAAEKGWCRRKRLTPNSDQCNSRLDSFCTSKGQRSQVCRNRAQRGGGSQSQNAGPQNSASVKGRTPLADLSVMKNIHSMGSQFLETEAKRFISGLLRGRDRGASAARDPTKVSEKFQTELDVNLEKNLLERLFEADIMLNPNQANTIVGMFRGLLGAFRGGRKKRKVGTNGFDLWESMPIPYEFKAEVPARVRKIIKQGIKLWEANTCVRWQENGRGIDRIEFENGGGCSSYVGRSGGSQPITIYPFGCDHLGIVAHEIGHALGFFHEQNRPDQKQHVTVNYKNILPNYYNNFVIQRASTVNDYGVPYDYGSVMHYDGWTKSFTFYSNQYAIIANKKEFQDTMGQRNGPSFADFKQVNMAYCSSTCSSNPGCQRNGYPDPNNCRQCKCPDGFGGKRCETVAPSDRGCGGVLQATRTRQTIRASHKKGHECNWLIQAPSGYTVKMSVNEQSFSCTEPCSADFLEVNLGGTGFESTGFRLCCRTAPSQALESSGNEAVLLSRASKSQYSFSVTYWSDAPGGGGGGGSVTPRGGRVTVAPRRTTTPSPIPRTFAPESGEEGCDDCNPWTAWTPCSYECGGCGTTTKKRRCPGRVSRSCKRQKRVRCNLEACASQPRKKPGFDLRAFKFFYDGCCFGLIRGADNQCGGLTNAVSGLFKGLTGGRG